MRDTSGMHPTTRRDLPPRFGLRTGTILVLLVPAIAVAAGTEHGGNPPFSDVEHWRGVFEDPERVEWQKPVSIRRLLAIRPGEVVADVGAGTGYFSRMLSYSVGRDGLLYSVEVEPELVEALRARDDIPFDNVEVILGEPDDPKLPRDGIDLILLVNTWHHIERREAYVDRLMQALHPRRGRVVLIDWREGELPMGPPPDHKLSRATVVAEFEARGFQLRTESFMLPYQYLLIFVPADRD